MILTELQYANIVISLSTLGQTDLTGNEEEGLRTLEFLLEQALENVRKVLSAPTSNPDYAPTPDNPF